MQEVVSHLAGRPVEQVHLERTPCLMVSIQFLEECLLRLLHSRRPLIAIWDLEVVMAGCRSEETSIDPTHSVEMRELSVLNVAR